MGNCGQFHYFLWGKVIVFDIFLCLILGVVGIWYCQLMKVGKCYGILDTASDRFHYFTFYSFSLPRMLGVNKKFDIFEGSLLVHEIFEVCGYHRIKTIVLLKIKNVTRNSHVVSTFKFLILVMLKNATG